MFRFEDFMIVELKQKEIEKKARDAWKFSSPLKESPVRKASISKETADCMCRPCEIC